MRKDNKTERGHIEIGSFKCSFENPTYRTVVIILMVLVFLVILVLLLKQ